MRRCRFGSAAFFIAGAIPASAAAPAPATDTPVATVQSFYDWDDAQWHDKVPYVMGKSLRDHLFSRRFAALVAADERCQQAEHGLCYVDYNPWIDGQDGEVDDLHLVLMQGDAKRAVVTAQFKSLGQKVALRFDLAQEDGRGWRIDDIHGRSVRSLAAHLCRFLAEYRPASFCPPGK